MRSDTNLARLAKQSSNHNLSSCAEIPEELLSMRNSQDTLQESKSRRQLLQNAVKTQIVESLIEEDYEDMPRTSSLNPNKLIPVVTPSDPKNDALLDNFGDQALIETQYASGIQNHLIQRDSNQIRSTDLNAIRDKSAAMASNQTDSVRENNLH